MPDPLARTPEPPYYAVVFSSLRTAGDEGYSAMAARMTAWAAQQPGFLGVESARNAGGLGLTVAYWQDLESISLWKSNTEHRIAQREGLIRWYSDFKVQIARVERQDAL